MRLDHSGFPHVKIIEHADSPVGPYDLLIAAHALALDLALITANNREFGRVAGLRLESWR